MREKDDWKTELSEAVAKRKELCHGGCEDRATVLRLYGRHVGAWCRGCWNEISRGVIPGLDRPKGLKRRTMRR